MTLTIPIDASQQMPSSKNFVFKTNYQSPLGNKLANRVLKPSAGFSLIELLISVFIFAVGFLGLISLQHVSFKLSHDASLQNTAMTLSDSVAEQLKVNELANIRADWRDLVETSLPEGKGELYEVGDHYQVRLQWLESQHSNDASNTPSYDMIFRSND